MPSRSIVAAILLFWAGTTGWLIYSEVSNQYGTGAPPHFAIDLVDEATNKAGREVSWTIFRQGEKIGVAKTSVNYEEADDSFELRSDVGPLDLGKSNPFRFEELISKYRMTREGSLLGVHMMLNVKFKIGVDVKVTLEGNVEKGSFGPKIQVDSSVLGTHTFDVPPVPVRAQASVLNPLHPVNRITGLVPGATWRMPLVNPVRDALASLVPSSSPTLTVLDARVLPELVVLEMEDKRGSSTSKRRYDCYVIEYEGEGMNARTWVRASDGLVLQQDARFQDDSMSIRRTLPP